MNKEELIEKLSNIEHDRWCNWQRYLHSCCTKNQDGSLTIPKEYVERWEYEINTKYEDLPDNIKESDRKEIYKIIPIIDEYLQHQLEEKDKVIDEGIKLANDILDLGWDYDEKDRVCIKLLEILERGKNEKKEEKIIY